MKILSPYYAQLFQALAALETHLVERQIVLENQFFFNEQFSCGLQYGETREAHSPIVSIKGKATKRYAHVTIWRDDRTGRYEINLYLL